MVKWVYVGYVRAHTHDVTALAMARPIRREGLFIETTNGAQFFRVTYILKVVFFNFWAYT